MWLYNIPFFVILLALAFENSAIDYMVTALARYVY